jgi:myo-inositol-1(or 4)-monophosphatase
MATYTANLNVMVKAARSAARGLVRDFGEVENLQVSVKGVSDFVSNADVKAEEIIKAELTYARPAYGWLGEESTEIVGADETRRWIVDPLDGTTNFLHGLPHWAISIAMEHKGEIVAAVILDPAKDEMFTAEKGQGAWMNGRRIRVSARRDLSECLFATGIPFGAKKTMPETMKELIALMPVCAGVRRFGAASLDLAYVAAGRYDGYWEREISAWDVAAGLLLVREAGGVVGDIDGGKDVFDSGTVLATNSDVNTRFVKALKG